MTRRASGTPDASVVAAVRESLVDPRTEDRPPLTLFHDLAIRHGPKLGPALVEMAAREGQRLHAISMGLLLVAAKAPRFAPTVKRRFFSNVAKHARAAILDRSVEDERKLELSSVLTLAGVPLTEAEVRAGLRDYEGTVRRTTRARLQEFPDTLGAVEGLLVSAELVDHDHPGAPVAEGSVSEALTLADEITRTNVTLGVSVLCVGAAIAHEHGVAPAASLRALSAAACTIHPRAAWYLAELGRWPTTGPLGEAARRHVAALAAAGVAPAPPRAGELSHALALGTDGAGSRSVSLFFKTGDGALDALSLLLNDEVGVKDAWPAWNEGAEVEEGIRATDLVAAPCDLALARKLVGDAFFRHQKSGRPVPGRFLLYRSLLGPEPIPAAPHVPDLGPYLLETVVRGAGIAEGSEALVEHPLFGNLWFASDAAYDFVRGLGRRRPRKGDRERALVGFLQAVAGEKDALARRLAANLEIEARVGRAKQPLNRLAARTWLALTEGVVPFEAIPYVRALGAHAIEAIRESLRQGYSSQAEVNQAGLERNAVLDEIIELFGGDEPRPRAR